MFLFKLFLFIMFSLVLVRPVYIYFSCRSALYERLRMTNVRLDSAMWVPGGRAKRRGDFFGRVETRLKFKGTYGNDNHRVTGYATIDRSNDRVTIEYANGGDILRQMQRDAPDLLDAEAGDLDLEQRIVFETNQRLERLIGNPEEYLKNDLNGDGGVDEAEWAAVRARVEKEVRAEMTGPNADAGW
jgi:hypothetical protein